MKTLPIHAYARLCAEGITPWQATRALHAGPKAYKEIARGDKQVADTDRQKSFPNTVLDRYPDLDTVELWIKYPGDFAAACEFSVAIPAQYKLVKDFCNSAAGSGRVFEEDWLRRAARPFLPEVMILYRQQLRIAAERDETSNPEMAASFRALGLNEVDVRNKVHYVCNAAIERRESEEALERRAPLTETIAYESDGHPCKVKSAAELPRILNAMNSGVAPHKQFVCKPYRPRAELVAHLQQEFPEVPAEAFTQIDANWEDKAQKTLEFKRRLINGENPVLLSKYLVPDFLVQGRRVIDQFRTVMGSKDSLDYFRFPEFQGSQNSRKSERPTHRCPSSPPCIDGF